MIEVVCDGTDLLPPSLGSSASPLAAGAAEATLTVMECQALERQLARAERDAGSRQGADTATKVRMDSEDECRRMERWPTGTR